MQLMVELTLILFFFAKYLSDFFECFAFSFWHKKYRVEEPQPTKSGEKPEKSVRLQRDLWKKLTCYLISEFWLTCYFFSEFRLTCYLISEYRLTCYLISEFRLTCYLMSEFRLTCYLISEFRLTCYLVSEFWLHVI